MPKIEQLGPENSALAALAETSPDPAGRELALVAARRGLTLGALARALSDLTAGDRTLHASNVRRYFESETLSPMTRMRLGKVLGVTEEHLILASGSPLSDRRIAHWRDVIHNELNLDGALFERGTGAKVGAIFDKDRRLERRVVESYALASLRESAGVFGSLEQRVKVMVGPWPRTEPERAAERTLRATLDLRALRRAVPREGYALAGIALNLNDLLPPAARDAVLATARQLLAAHGHDVSLMDEELERALARITRSAKGATT